MRFVIGWIAAGTLLAFSVLIAVSAWNTRETATWVVISVGVAGGLGAALRSVESATPLGGKELLLATLKPMLSFSAGAAAFLSTFAAECHDVAGVPSWERCQSWFGTPTVDWPGAPVIALALGLGVGYLVWRLLGRVFPNRGD
ncbi:MAG: hypothetical protein OXS33_04400 [bacterium]|nr:hypothetical protein [bacterium]